MQVTMTPLTSAEKQSRRVTALDAIAQAAGWQTWKRYETGVKRGVVKIAKNPQRRNVEKLNAFNGAYYEVWYCRGEQGAHCISKSTYAKDEKDAIKKATAAAPASLDMSKVTARKVE